MSGKLTGEDLYLRDRMCLSLFLVNFQRENERERERERCMCHGDPAKKEREKKRRPFVNVNFKNIKHVAFFYPYVFDRASCIQRNETSPMTKHFEFFLPHCLSDGLCQKMGWTIIAKFYT